MIKRIWQWFGGRLWVVFGAVGFVILAIMAFFRRWTERREYRRLMRHAKNAALRDVVKTKGDWRKRMAEAQVGAQIAVDKAQLQALGDKKNVSLVDRLRALGAGSDDVD